MEEMSHNVVNSAFFWQVLCKPDLAISLKILTKSLSKDKLSFLKGCFSQYGFELAYKKIAELILACKKATPTWSSQKSFFWKIILCRAQTRSKYARDILAGSEIDKKNILSSVTVAREWVTAPVFTKQKPERKMFHV